jgi:ribosomal-protein-alanine acetyltransferase
MTHEIDPTPASPVVARDSYVIEQAGWRDLNGLRRLERACFNKDAWPLLDLIGVLALPNVVHLKAVVDGEMVGFIAGDVRPGRRLAWIATLAVLPEYRGRGIGKTLLQACEELLKVSQIRLNVRASNQVAIRLYEESGYQKAGLWKEYYADGEDALVMEKERRQAPPG